MRPTGSIIPDERLKAVLMVGALYSREGRYLIARKLLTEKFGPIMLETEPRSWDHTLHYSEELAQPIIRRFLFFSEPIWQGELADIKVATIALERDLSEDGKRTVNLDPGYMTLAKLVLASTKDYSHRIYLGKGIFAEVTLAYAKKEGFKPQVYTYMDYRDAHYLDLFNEVRKTAKEMLDLNEGVY